MLNRLSSTFVDQALDLEKGLPPPPSGPELVVGVQKEPQPWTGGAGSESLALRLLQPPTQPPCRITRCT